jgi:hypothetical protein
MTKISNINIIKKLNIITKQNDIIWVFKSNGENGDTLTSEYSITNNKAIFIKLTKLTRTMYLDIYLKKYDELKYIKTLFDPLNEMFTLFINSKYVNFMLNNKKFYEELYYVDLDWIIVNKSYKIIKLILEDIVYQSKRYVAELFLSENVLPYIKINGEIIYVGEKIKKDIFNKIYDEILV